ncbi:unnamed protein product [Ilex paraguariensis]|uniref:BZIP domain-containing protein n=1 Tax=Ilex paraguariensis TaxID=185542 RepID=A0ABC8STB1_9AQUA
MASSKVMASTSSANPDLPHQQSSIHSLTVSEQSKNFGSMNMDELLKNIYADTDSFPPSTDDGGGGGGGSVVDGCGGVKNEGNKTVDEVWKQIVSGGGNSRESGMTLEDFLTKAGAVREEDVRVSPVMAQPETDATSGFGVEPMMNVAQFSHMQSGQNGMGGFGVEPVGFGNGIDGRMVAVGTSAAGGSGGGRGKRRIVEEPPVDKATQQKQRRMIKNRESAARSRERKQAYTVELESLVTQLEEENARLVSEEAEQTKQRYKQVFFQLSLDQLCYSIIHVMNFV